MAPVLVCPECGTKHPLNSVGPRSAFPCSGCGRTLKVPARATAATTPAWPPPPGAADHDPLATQMLSTTAPPVASATAVAPPFAAPPIAAADLPPAPIPAPLSQNGALPDPLPTPPLGPPPGIAPARSGAPVPAAPDFVPARPIRFLLWIVAVPLAFFVVFGLARLFGFLSTNDVTDVALAEGFSRFWPVVRLLPFVALATAGFVHGGVYAIAQIRAKRHPSAPSGEPPSRSAPSPRTARPSRPRRGQTSRPDA